MDEAPHDQAHDTDRLIDELIEREGEFVNHPADRGGPTRFGITEAVARAHGYSGAMAMLPRDEALFLVKAGEARHWRKQSGRYEQLYLAEQGSRAQTIANYRAAAETARKQDLANAGRVAAEQRAISERTTHDLESRLADARLRAQRLQLGQGSPAAAGGRARAALVPAAGATPGAAGRPAEEDGFPLDAKSFSIEERLLATEQAIQLDELIKWVTGQAAIDNGDPKSGSSPSP